MPTVKLPVPAGIAQAPAVQVGPVSAAADPSAAPRTAPPAAIVSGTIPVQDAILRRGARTGALTHVQEIPARRGRRGGRPSWPPRWPGPAPGGRGPIRPGPRGWPGPAPA